MSLGDVPVVGRLAVWSGALLDVLFHSGEVVAEVVAFAIGHLGLLVPILRLAEQLANRLPFLPAGVFEDLLTVALVALLVFEVLRLGSRFNSQT